MSKQHEVKAAPDYLGALMDAAVDAIVLIGERGDIVRFNRSAEKLFGYIAAEVIGRNVNCLMPEPYHTEHDGYLDRYHRTSEPRIIGIGREVVARRKDGSTFPIDLSVGEFQSGDQHGFVGILRDISGRKEQERQLLRSSEELRLVFDNAPTAMLTSDPQGRILNANRACCELLGYERGELLQLRHSDLMHAEDRPSGVSELQHLQQAGDSARRQMRFVRKDGTVVHTLQYSAKTQDAEGRPLTIIEIVDRTEIYKATREAEELRMRLTHVARIGTLGEMVSGIAHEVNQPLTAIANYASACRRMLNSGQAQPQELAGTLGKISDQAERAGQVIRGLRALLRKRDAVREPLDCNQLVREVSALIDFELRQAGFRLLLQLAPQLPKTLGDGVQIQQVMLNLIRNGLDAMQEHARGDFIQVSTAATGSWVQFVVSDSGPGLNPDVAERLFEP
ncbi:MAG TPA: PAS domain S-box protein, partial [Nevskiaceae bacterium]|nr:PAS domain S-box protein [Nevskiaceae bacterium]